MAMKDKEFLMNDKIKMMIKKTKIGDHITVRTIKGLDMDAKSFVVGCVRSGEVIGKTPKFVILRYQSGITESFLWADLILNKEAKVKLRY